MGYLFDDIGNRTFAETGGDASGSNLRSASFTNNSLNQLTSRDGPDGFDVLGLATAQAAVAVNSDSDVYRRGEYFRKELTVNNSSTAQYPLVSVTSSQGGTTNSQSGSVYVPKTPEVLTYDDDGNLEADGRWDYTWDGENRLVQMEPSSSVTVPDAAKRKLQFAYDWQGRRIWKAVSVWTNSTWSVVSSNRFAYEPGGWNLVAELHGTNAAVARSYLWGLDLSLTLNGAGGVGGLVAVKDAGLGVHFAAYDGNGNVIGLADGADGTISAAYEYGPFGEPIRLSGEMGSVNPFRFSTKFTDDDSDLVYYGYRYYSPSLGQWVSRDPIGEAGGLNPYGFVGNWPINGFDPLGLDYGDWWDYRTWFNGGFVEGYRDAAARQWRQIHDTFAGLGQLGGNLSTGYGRNEYAQMLSRLGPLLERLLEDECFREQAKKLLGHEFGNWLDSLQTAEGLGAFLGGIGTELAVTAGTAGLGKVKWLDELESLARRLDRVTPDAARTAPNSTRGWSVGDPINNLTSKGNVPSWDAVRQRFWKNEALNSPPGAYSPENLARMQRGLAPQQINPNTGRLEFMELHHTPARRDGGMFDVQKLWPDEHAAVDPFRHTGN